METDTIIVERYFGLLEILSLSNKLDLISRLSASVKADLDDRKSRFKKSFGAFESEKTAEEIIEKIRDSRLFAREIESF